MSKSSSNDSLNSAPTTAVLDELEYIPCVQYGFPVDKGPRRTPKLQTIFEPIPEDATTVSPVYTLTDSQYKRQEELESGYGVKGATSIATELQNECEVDDNVLYPIHIESDAYHEEGPAPLIEWFREFVVDYLDVPFDTCQLFFSGNRSIHVHVPRFVSGKGDREQLREMAETFNEEAGAELDCALYDRKRLFRLPGVQHRKTSLQKVKIEPRWTHEKIIREASNTTTDVPSSYETLLRHVFAAQPSLTVESPQTSIDPPYDLFWVLDSQRTVLEFKSERKSVNTPLIEQVEYPNDPSAVPKWAQYNTKEFSPYALASGNGRSVAVVRVKGGAFSRKNVRNGTTLVPVYFYGAQGCAGEEFTKDREHAPLQLSDHDYEKWDHAEGDDVVIIGGQSRNSRIFVVTAGEAEAVGRALTGEDASRHAALDYLDGEGYDVGKGGVSGASTRSEATEAQGYSDDDSPNYRETEAAKLQRQAEKEGIETLTHEERSRVACRILKRGWKPAWEWFEKQFGSGFKPDVTREQFLSIINAYPTDYSHVEVPPQV